MPEESTAAQPGDAELNAIEVLLVALTSLKGNARGRVLAFRGYADAVLAELFQIHVG